MLPFSPLSKTEAPETSLRMSLPEAGFATTPTVTGKAPPSGEAVEEARDQAVRGTGGLHLDHVALAVEDLDPRVLGQVLRVGGRHDLVLPAPDREYRHSRPRQVRDAGLPAVGEELVGDGPQGLVHAVLALVLELVVDELARHELGVGEEELQDPSHIFAPVGGDKALDVFGVRSEERRVGKE